MTYTNVQKHVTNYKRRGLTQIFWKFHKKKSISRKNFFSIIEKKEERNGKRACKRQFLWNSPTTDFETVGLILELETSFVFQMDE